MKSARKQSNLCGTFTISTDVHRHTYPGKLTFHKHLGSDRHEEMNLLFERNIVFTTFATATKEAMQGKSLLSKIHWFRVFLDEGNKTIKLPLSFY
jgi:SWI/SNF-related matrix-associated actin-dependent regulator of chromatin subfamily A3